MYQLLSQSTRYGALYIVVVLLLLLLLHGVERRAHGTGAV